MDNQEEIYPMPSFVRLSVADLDASARWYMEGLGFRHVFTMPGPGGGPGLVHLRWAKYADVLLHIRPAEPGPRGVGITVCFNCYGGMPTVDQVAERVASTGAHIVAPPAKMPWNTRECTVQDPDGYRLNFTEPLDITRSMDDVIQQVVNSGI